MAATSARFATNAASCSGRLASVAEATLESGARWYAATGRKLMHLARAEVAVPPSRGYGGGRSFVRTLVGNAKTESRRHAKIRVTSN